MRIVRPLVALALAAPAAAFLGCACPDGHCGHHGPPPGPPPQAMQGPMPGRMPGPMQGPMNGPMNGPMQGPMAGMMQGPGPGPMQGPFGPHGPMQGPMPGMMQGPGPGPGGPGEGREQGPSRQEIQEALHRFMERVERLEVAMHERGGGQHAPGGPEAPNPEHSRRAMEEMQAGLQQREARIHELEQQVEKLQGAVKLMSHRMEEMGKHDGPPPQDAPRPKEEQR